MRTHTLIVTVIHTLPQEADNLFIVQRMRECSRKRTYFKVFNIYVCCEDNF